jgi:hypothetical protein
MATQATSAPVETPLSPEERQEIIEKAKDELPALSEQAEKAIKNLQRISEGLRPRE